jgi:dipeptidyl aminopeptidase/acylaminoacyl peptidase/protein-disulfide isomerase
MRKSIPSLTFSVLLFTAVQLHAQFAPPPASTPVHDSTALQPPAGARVALIDFEDLECPDCARANPLLEEAAAKYNIPVVRHDFPLPFHHWSMDAAINARWFDGKGQLGNEYRDAVFAAQPTIVSRDSLRQFTQKFADSHKIDLPLEIDPDGSLAALVKADFALGKSIGVGHTPTIWVVTANSKGAPFVEVVDRTMLLQMIEQAIADTAPRPMTFADMMKMKRLGETAVSPDGKWLAYSVTTVNLEQNTKTAELWLQAISGGEPRKLAVGQPGDGGPQFAPDGKRILFESSRDGGQQVWLADFDPATGATANPKKLTTISTEADNALWSPDGKSIVFTSAVYPDCPAITPTDPAGNKCNADRDAALASSKVKAQIFTHLLYRHWNHYTGDKRSHQFLASVETAAIRDLTPNDPHDVPPFSLEGGGCGCAFAPDSKELAFTENLDPEPAISTNADIFTLDLTNPQAKPMKVSTSLGGDFNPAYSPDGKYLAWRSQARAGYEGDKFRLVLYDRAAKTIKDVLRDFDGWVDEFVWVPDAFPPQIYFTSARHGEENIYSTKPLNGGVEKQIAGGAEFSDLHVITRTPPSGTVYIEGIPISVFATGMKVGRPSEAVIITVAGYWGLHPCDQEDTLSCLPANGNQPHLITHLNDALLVQLDLPKMEDFWFTAADKTKLQGFLIKPPTFDPAKKYPVKFLIHGGPQGNWGDSWSYRWNAELFAANGYVVVMINPRGSTGYGQAIVDGVNGDWGGKPFTDLMTGLDYAEQHYPFIDKHRECALGASYGGYMANWVLGHTDRFKCIVTHDGMFNAESAYGTTEELWFNEWEFKGKPWDYYGKPDSENPYRKWSPALSAKNFKTPTLVIHGQLDYRLDVSEGFQLFTTLQRLKVPSKMLYFPDEGHWVLKPQNAQLWWKTVNDWVDQWTRTKE